MFLKSSYGGAWVAQTVKQLPLAQVIIPESRDGTPRRALCSARNLLLPVAPPSGALSLSLCQLNK